MKKTALIMIAVLMLGLLAGCGSKPAGDAGGEAASGNSGAASAATVDLDSLGTLGDAFAIEGKDEESEQRATYDDKYVYAFAVGGTYYRVIADLPADVSEKIFALEYDDDYDKNEMALVSDLEITTKENLSEQILPQEELDKLVGKTGQELFDAGWRPGMFYNTEDMEFWLEYGAFSYTTHFDGEVPAKDAEEFDAYEGLADKKLVDITYQGIGDAAYLEEE